MAILIPSNNIYKIDNKIVRKNQIRIVEAIEDTIKITDSWEKGDYSNLADISPDGEGVFVATSEIDLSVVTGLKVGDKIKISEYEIEIIKDPNVVGSYYAIISFFYNARENWTQKYYKITPNVQEFFIVSSPRVSFNFSKISYYIGFPQIYDTMADYKNSLLHATEKTAVCGWIGGLSLSEIYNKKSQYVFCFPINYNITTQQIVSPNNATMYSVEVGDSSGRGSLVKRYNAEEQTRIYKAQNEMGTYSLPKNELSQKTTKYGDKEIVEYLSTEILKKWVNGKETATILCDINDYYHYNATAYKFKGNKSISLDNSTGKMSFAMYDQVIPMVYGSDGQDRPMSTYQDGTPKVFQVLGSKIYYDGAVWQELSLQEVDKSEIL